jgi:transposase
VVSTHDQDGVTRRARAQQVALFRYQLICPALEAGLSTKARGRVVRAIAARTHQGPFGGTHRYFRDSVDRWIRRYRAGGFDALTPSLRQPGTRIDTGVLELAVALKRENPDRTAAQVARILRAASGYSPSESTLLRLFHRRELMGPAAGGGVVFGRFEAETPNARWVGDALHAPAGRWPKNVPVRVFGRSFSAGCGLPVRLSPRTPCAWPPRWNRRWPPAASRPAPTLTTDPLSSTPGCCGPAPSSGSG